MRYRRSIRSTTIQLTIVLLTTLRRYFYRIRNSSGFIKDLRAIRIRSIGLLVGLKIQRIIVFRAQQKTFSQKSIRASIVLLYLLSLQRQLSLYQVRLLIGLEIINKLKLYLLVDLTPTKAILEVTLNKLIILQLIRIASTSYNLTLLNLPLIYQLYLL